MKYNIIGDIHGRSCWKELVIDDGTNIFVGDYFSPYNFGRTISFEEQKKNFLDIIAYKKEHPETVLLVGNHDEDHWHWLDSCSVHCSRHDYVHEQEIKQLFEEHAVFFQAAYAIGEKALVTHAGLSMQWYMMNRYFPHKRKDMSTLYLNTTSLNQCDDVYEAIKKLKRELTKQGYDSRFFDKTCDIIFWNNCWYIWQDDRLVLFEVLPSDAATFINTLWKDKPGLFSFAVNAQYGDYYGTSPTHSPLWIRQEGLEENNPFSGTMVEQIYGHTLDEDIQTYYDHDTLIKSKDALTGKMVMVDCLEEKCKSYVFSC